MMPPGHVAATWGVATLLKNNNAQLARLDYRLLTVSTLLPDFIDKPLVIFIFTDAHTSQLIAHSFLFNVVLLVCALLWWRKALPYVLAFNTHLLADRMWNHTESFWWPLFGWDTFWEYKFVNTPQAMVEVYWDIVTQYPQVWLIEIIALLFLIWFIYRYQLYRWGMLKHFVLTGHINILPEESLFKHNQKQSLQASVQSTVTQTPGSG